MQFPQRQLVEVLIDTAHLTAAGCRKQLLAMICDMFQPKSKHPRSSLQRKGKQPMHALSLMRALSVACNPCGLSHLLMQTPCPIRLQLEVLVRPL